MPLKMSKSIICPLPRPHILPMLQYVVSVFSIFYASNRIVSFVIVVSKVSSLKQSVSLEYKNAVMVSFKVKGRERHVQLMKVTVMGESS